MVTISYAGYLGKSPVISAQFALEMCVAAWNHEKFTLTPYFWVQGRSRSSMLVTWYPRKAGQQLLMVK